MYRLSDYNVRDVEVERERMIACRSSRTPNRAIWLLSNQDQLRAASMSIGRFAEAARKIAQAVGPEIDAELTELTDGTVTGINQVED